jgi:hypothetical protein
VVTLEISTTEISLLEVEKGRVIRWATQSLEPGTIEEEVVVNHQALGDAIKQLISLSGVKSKDIIVSVSGLYSLSRNVIVAVPPGGEVTRQAVVDLATEVMPISEDEMYISWLKMGPLEEGQQVLVMSVPRDIIDSEMQALKIAGLNPRMLDLKAMALIRAINKKQALIINIGHTTYDIIMVVNGLVEVMRTTAWKPDGLTLEEELDQLVLNLELTVGFYNSSQVEHSLDPATPLFITGQLSSDSDLVAELEERVAYKIEQPVPPLEYPQNLPVSQYAVNFGLALKGSQSGIDTEQNTYSPPDINFLPGEYKPWRPSARQVYSAFAVTAILVLLVPLYQLTSNAMDETSKLEAEFNTLNELLEMRKTELAKREPLKKAIDSYNIIFNNNSDITEDLDTVISIAAELNVEIMTLAHQISGLTIECKADSAVTFDDFITALEESGRFSTPVIPPEGYPYIKGGTIKVTPMPPEEESE